MRKNNKRALIISALCLLLSVSMLVGSTYAWFTDTARTTVNTIQAGTLDIDIQDASGNSLNGKTLSFANVNGETDILWEPGCTYRLQEVKLVNNGNLALKFKVDIKGIVGDTELADVIEVMIGGENKGTLSELMLDADGAAHGFLLPNESASVGQIELHMQESAGNQYQGKSINGLAIFVTAAQYTHEYDSNDNTYDANAEFGPVQADHYVNTSADLVEMLKAAEVGDVIAAKTGTYTITENVETKGTLIVESGEAVTIDMAGHTLKSAVSAELNAPTVENYGYLTIVGGTINNPNATAGKTNVAAIHNASGELVLQGCTVKNVAPISGGDYALTVDGGKVTLTDCTVYGARGGIALSGNGVVNMVGGSVSAKVYYPLYVRGSGASSFDGVTFTKENNSKGKAITYNAIGSDGGSVAFIGCSFNAETASAVSLDISKVYAGFTFDGCTYNNVKAPA